MENTPYPTAYNPALNASRIHHVPMAASYQQSQQQPHYFPFMPHPQMQQQPQLPLPFHGFPMYPFPTHNLPLIPVRQPFHPMNQFYAPPAPQSAPPQQVYVAAPPSTPTTRRPVMHNTSLNASLGATSFNDTSIRFNPMAGRVRSRDHSLIIDQTTSSSDRSFQQSFIDPDAMVSNNDLIQYCVNELCRKQLTEQELVSKVSKSRRFKKFGKDNLPSAISIILNSFPCFIPRTFIVKTSPNDLQPFSKTVWKADKRYQKPRGSKLNATMFEIPERSSGCGEVLSVLGDIASLNLDENQPPTTISSMEKILDGFKV